VASELGVAIEYLPASSITVLSTNAR